MPIYNFRCSECLEEEEVLLPMANRNKKRIHSCGAAMERLMSPVVAIIQETSLDMVKATLNKENGYNFPGGDKHRPRYEQRMAEGLNYQRPLEERVFTGFG